MPEHARGRQAEALDRDSAAHDGAQSPVPSLVPAPPAPSEGPPCGRCVYREDVLRRNKSPRQAQVSDSPAPSGSCRQAQVERQVCCQALVALAILQPPEQDQDLCLAVGQWGVEHEG